MAYPLRAALQEEVCHVEREFGDLIVVTEAAVQLVAGTEVEVFLHFDRPAVMLTCDFRVNGNAQIGVKSTCMFK